MNEAKTPTQIPFLRSAMNYNPDVVSEQTALDPMIDPDTGEETPSLTQQSFKEESDINEIVRRFGLTGAVPGNYKAPIQGDFEDVMDYQTAMNAVTQAREQFMELPGDIRERFANDPQRLINFLENENNREEAIKLGILAPPPEKTRDVVQAVDELRTVLTTPEKK